MSWFSFHAASIIYQAELERPQDSPIPPRMRVLGLLRRLPTHKRVGTVSGLPKKDVARLCRKRGAVLTGQHDSVRIADVSQTSKSPKDVIVEAWEVSQNSLRAFSHRFSPKKFTPHQLFACLVLKSFLKTDYRGVVQHLRDCHELADTIGLAGFPHFTTLQNAFDSAGTALGCSIPGTSARMTSYRRETYSELFACRTRWIARTSNNATFAIRRGVICNVCSPASGTTTIPR